MPSLLDSQYDYLDSIGPAKSSYGSGSLLDSQYDYLDALSPAQAKPVEMGDTARGFKRAFAQVPELAYGTAALGAMSAEKIFGEGGLSTAAKDYFSEKYQAKQAENQKYAPTVEFTDAWDNIGSEPGKMVDWLQDSAGYVIGQGLQTVITGGIGALAGRMTLGTIVAGSAARAADRMVLAEVEKRGLKGLAATQLAEELLPEATKTAARNLTSALGAGVVLTGQNLGMEAGDIYGGLTEEAKKTGKEITGADLVRAWGSAGAAAATETLTDMLGLGALTGRIKIGGKAMQEMPGLGGRAARGGAAAAIGLPLEASQEYAQTYLEQVGAGAPTDTPEAQKERINAAAVGGLGGAVMGGGIGLIQSAQRPEVIPEELPQAPPAETPKTGLIASATPMDIIAEVMDPAKSIDEAIDAAVVIATGKNVTELTQEAPGRIGVGEDIPEAGIAAPAPVTQAPQAGLQVPDLVSAKLAEAVPAEPQNAMQVAAQAALAKQGEVAAAPAPAQREATAAPEPVQSRESPAPAVASAAPAQQGQAAASAPPQLPAQSERGAGIASTEPAPAVAPAAQAPDADAAPVISAKPKQEAPEGGKSVDALVTAIYRASETPYDNANKRFPPADRESIITAIDEAKAGGVEITHIPAKQRGWSEQWSIKTTDGRNYLLSHDPSTGRTVWHAGKQITSGVEPIQAPAPQTQAVAAPEGGKPEVVVKVPDGQLHESGQSAFVDAEKNAQDLPRDSYIPVRVERNDVYGKPEPARYGAFVSNGDGTATYVYKTFPESRQPIDAAAIAKLVSEQRGKAADNAAKRAQHIEQTKRKIADKGIAVGATWNDAEAYVEGVGKAGRRKFSKATVTKIDDDGTIHVTATLPGSRAPYQFKTGPDSRLFDNYKPAPPAQSAPAGAAATSPYSHLAHITVKRQVADETTGKKAFMEDGKPLREDQPAHVALQDVDERATKARQLLACLNA